MTNTGERLYWHIAIATTEREQLAINLSKVGEKTLLTPYRFDLRLN